MIRISHLKLDYNCDANGKPVFVIFTVNKVNFLQPLPSPRLFRGLSAAARVEYVLVVLVDVVATADKRREDVPLVCPSVAQTSLSMAADQRVTISWLSVGTADLHACSAV